MHKDSRNEKEVEHAPCVIYEEPKVETKSVVDTNLHQEYTVDNQSQNDLVTEDTKQADAENDEHRESLQRPQDLPISNEMIEANRKINLIGNCILDYYLFDNCNKRLFCGELILFLELKHVYLGLNWKKKQHL